MRLEPRRPSDAHSTQLVVVGDIETIVDDAPDDGSFPPWSRHKPVAAAFLTARTTGDEPEFHLDTLICEDGNEDAFYQAIDAILVPGATFVGFNSRAFDLVALRLSAMAAHQFALPNIARLAHAQRFGREHADLCDLFGAYGAARGHPLAAICERLAIPVKTSISGGDVGALWRAGDRDAVLRYVSEDVMATYLVWLCWAAFRDARPELIAEPLAYLARWIERSPELAHLLPFATCPLAMWARPIALGERVGQATRRAEIRLERDRDERAFRGETIL